MDEQSSSDEDREEIAALTELIAALKSDIDATRGRTDSLKRQLLTTNIMTTASAFSSHTVKWEGWTCSQQTTWFQNTVPQVPGDRFNVPFHSG